MYRPTQNIIQTVEFKAQCSVSKQKPVERVTTIVEHSMETSSYNYIRYRSREEIAQQRRVYGGRTEKSYLV